MKLFKLILFSLLFLAILSFKTSETNYIQKNGSTTAFSDNKTFPLRDAVIIIEHKAGLSDSEIQNLLSCISRSYGVFFEFETENNISNTITWKVKYNPNHPNNYLIKRATTTGKDNGCGLSSCDKDENHDKDHLCSDIISITYMYAM